MKVNYASEEYECRRSILLNYFGEQFSPQNCKGTCDVCKGALSAGIEYRDVCHEALNLVNMVSLLLHLVLLSKVDSLYGCCCNLSVLNGNFDHSLEK